MAQDHVCIMYKGTYVFPIIRRRTPGRVLTFSRGCAVEGTRAFPASGVEHLQGYSRFPGGVCDGCARAIVCMYVLCASMYMYVWSCICIKAGLCNCYIWLTSWSVAVAGQR